jgi:GTP cyclohydrolase III
LVVWSAYDELVRITTNINFHNQRHKTSESYRQKNTIRNQSSFKCEKSIGTAHTWRVANERIS